MKIVLQRVKGASVTIKNNKVANVAKGLLILLGVGHEDTLEDIEWLVKKISTMRIFNDEQGKMNLSIQDINGSFLVVSQFTLQASTKKGTRPSYIKAARPDIAIPLYETFCTHLREVSGLNVETGVFGADMKVELINDGPVTILLDSKVRE